MQHEKLELLVLGDANRMSHISSHTTVQYSAGRFWQFRHGNIISRKP
jgi:hypothetical protein